MNHTLRIRLLTLGVLAVVFGAGLVAGIAMGRSMEAGSEPLPQALESAADTASSGEESRSEGEERSRWIIHRVELDAEQRVAVDSVLGYYRSHVREMATEYRQEFGVAIQATRNELREILRADQRAVYDSLLAETDRRRQRNRED
jgi:hypothetical protein